MEIYRVIAALGAVGHSFREGTSASQFGQRSGIVSVTLRVQVLRTDDYAHVSERKGFGVRAGGIAGEFRLVSSSRCLRQTRLLAGWLLSRLPRLGAGPTGGGKEYENYEGNRRYEPSFHRLFSSLGCCVA